MCNRRYDNKYDDNIADKLVHVLKWYRTRTLKMLEVPTAFVWNLDRGEMLGTLGVTESVLSVSLTLDGSKAVTGSENAIVTIWNINDLSKITDIKLHEDPYPVKAMFSPDGKKIAGGFGSSIQIFDSEGNPLGDSFICCEDWAWKLTWFSDNKRLLVSGFKNFSVVDSTNLTPPVTFRFPDNIVLYDTSLSPDESKIAAVGDFIDPSSQQRDGLVQIYDSIDLGLKFDLRFGYGAQSVTFNNNGDRVVFDCFYSEDLHCNSLPIVNYDYVNKTIDGRLFAGHTGIVRSLTRCRTNDSYFFSGGSDGQVLLWDVKAGLVVKRMKGDLYSVSCVDVSEDCRIGISGHLKYPLVTEQMVKWVLENDSRTIPKRG